MNSSPRRFETFRVLVIDDTVGIHEDIRRILAPRNRKPDLESLESSLLDEAQTPSEPEVNFTIDSAYQGEEGIERIRQANAEHQPYALAFIDMRMPPGIDGRETIRRLWQIDSELQVVVCTAFSDYSWEEIAATTGPTTRVVILRKPFDAIEVRQLAHVLTKKWHEERQARLRLEELEQQVLARTHELDESRTVFHLLVDEAAHGQVSSDAKDSPPSRTKSSPPSPAEPPKRKRKS